MANLPEDEEDKTKLRGKHPVINKDKGTAKVIGCTSKNYGAVKVETERGSLNKNTYARSDQGLREITDRDIEYNKHDKVKNGNDIK